MGVLTPYFHVELDDNGVPLISGTTMKVVELVQQQMYHGCTPEELLENYPYLTMGQIHSALAYYWDHKQELDADIARRAQYAREMQAKTKPNRIMQELARKHFGR